MTKIKKKCISCGQYMLISMTQLQQKFCVRCKPGPNSKFVPLKDDSLSESAADD